MSKIRTARLKKELKIFKNSPPLGISMKSVDEQMTQFEAVVLVTSESPYQNASFKLNIQITEKYPMEPPLIRFLTPIYHPNIDSQGRICLDVLKNTAQGSWSPSLSLSNLLLSIQMLISNPNPHDPLMPDIAFEFINNKQLFNKKAADHTKKYSFFHANTLKKENWVYTENSENQLKSNNDEKLNKLNDLVEKKISPSKTSVNFSSHTTSLSFPCASTTSKASTSKLSKKRKLN